MLSIYLFTIVYVTACVFFFANDRAQVTPVSEAPAPQPPTPEQQPIIFVEEAPAPAPAEDTSNFATVTHETVNAVTNEDTEANATAIAESMTKKEILALIKGNGWFKVGVSQLNKRELAEFAAERQALAN